MSKRFDCVVCGSCTVDVVVRPFPINEAIGHCKLLSVDPIQATTGGIVSNSGTAFARLGTKVAAFSCVGNDQWSTIIRGKYQSEGIETSRLLTSDQSPSSVTIVFVDETGERSFAHSQGAPKQMDRQLYLDHLDLFADSRMMLIGYYSLMPNLEEDLPEVLAAIRSTGCQTAMDAAGAGGTMQPLDRILPHLDFYVPSLVEATSQTGESDPEAIIRTLRAAGGDGLLGVKLGADGALLSPAPGELLHIPAIEPPAPIVDTTGAGDAFYAGLLTGLLRGMSIEAAGRLAAATGACCITGVGASEGLRNFEETIALLN